MKRFYICALYILRSFDSDLPAESENPTEEDMADGHPDDHPEGAHIVGVNRLVGVNRHIRAEAVDNCVDYGVVADQLYLLTLAAIHPKGGRKEIVNIKVFQNRDGIFRKNVRTGTDAVHTKAANGLMLVRITKHIVIITIPDQTIGAEDVPFAIVVR